MKKALILVSMILLMTGCTSGKFKQNYEVMQIKDDGIHSYVLDLRIYGNVENKKINEIIRIDNYNNTKFKIEKSSKLVKETLYVLDDKTYAVNDLGIYIESTKTSVYSDPSIYLMGLKGISNKIIKQEKIVGETEYDVYNVMFDRLVMINMLKDSILKDMDIKEDVNGKVYLDANGYVYRIIYNINDIVINANYFGINTIKNITLPN